MKKKAKLLYIISEGHSGSTLLDLLSGCIPRVFSMGEMHFFSWQLKQGDLPEDPQNKCSCGFYFDKCDFWNHIINEINEENSINIYAKPEDFNVSINRGIIRNRTYLNHKLLNKAFKIALNNRALDLIQLAVYKFYEKSIKNTWELYDKVAIRSNSTYVVDSSKNPIRFKLLQMYRPDDVKLLILKRDIKGVASSSHHGLSENTIRERAKAWHNFYNKLIPKIKNSLQERQYLEITYEEMCQYPNPSLQKIADFIGNQEKIETLKHISPYSYHTVQGNPMRLAKKDLEIRYDERWRERLTPAQIEWLNEFSN